MTGALAHCKKGEVTSSERVTQGRIIPSPDQPTLSLIRKDQHLYWVLKGPLPTEGTVK